MPYIFLIGVAIELKNITNLFFTRRVILKKRAANATIKGYLYQFDYSLLKILESENDDDIFIIEGSEDIDIYDTDTSVHVQCKYYEGTEYNH